MPTLFLCAHPLNPAVKRLLGADGAYLQLFPVILDRYVETGKADVVREAAERAARVLVRLPPPETRASHA